MPTPLPARDPSIRRQITGLLLVAGLLVIALVVAIATRHDMFSKKARLHFVTENATGLAPGTTVRLSGYHIGSVSTMTLQPDLKVRVTLSIDTEPFASLRSDASAVLVREQLRAPAIEIRPGKGADALVGDDPLIAYSRGNTLTEIADDLRERIAPILADVKEITGTVRSKQGEIAAVIENAASATRQLADTTQQLRALAGEVRGRVGTLGAQAQGMLAEANQAVARTGNLVGQAQKSLDTVNATLPGLMQKSSEMLDQLNGVARDAKTISASTASSVPGLLRSVTPLVDDTRDMVSGIKQAWPVRSLLPPPPSPLLPIDSLDAMILRDASIRY